MTDQNFNLHYWQYFIAIESDLANTARFVEPVKANMKCYSLEFARILLAVGSEIDVLCKVLCKNDKLQNINEYRTAIKSKFTMLTQLEVHIPRYNLILLPWKQWEENNSTNPTWWKAYNDVKHNRHSSFTSANLSNTLNATAGLFVLVCYICVQELFARKAVPLPQMLSLDPKLNGFERTLAMPGFILPEYKLKNYKFD